MADDPRLDELTGALHRIVLHETPEALVHAASSAPCCSVLLCNPRELLRFNDEHGHDAGDALLQAVARLWLAHLPADGALIRVGGGEFAAVLPGIDLDEAERLERELEATSPIGWRAGFASWTADQTLRDALLRADDDFVARHIRETQA